MSLDYGLGTMTVTTTIIYGFMSLDYSLGTMTNSTSVWKEVYAKDKKRREFLLFEWNILK